MSDKQEAVFERNSLGSKPGSESNFKPASLIVQEATRAITDLVPAYEKLGFAGIFAVAAIVIVIIVITLSFITGIPVGGSWHTGISFYEEVLFAFLALGFAIVSTVFLIQKNAKETKIKLKAMEIDMELNKLLHEQTMARLQSQGDAAVFERDQKLADPLVNHQPDDALSGK